MSEVGFIILRNVRDELTNKYWIKCIECIRKYYPYNKILIIDDNSNYDFVSKLEDTTNTFVIRGEYPGRGELLPYYYYLTNKLFDTAVIIHDSVFINSYIDFRVDKYKMLWSFEHDCDQIEDETLMIDAINDKELKMFYENKWLWKGCFGCMSVITHDYLTQLNNKYDISKLLDYVKKRYNRCSFERVIGSILQKEQFNYALFGDIHRYCPWGIPFEEIENYRHLPAIKCWTGR